MLDAEFVNHIEFVDARQSFVVVPWAGDSKSRRMSRWLIVHLRGRGVSSHPQFVNCSSGNWCAGKFPFA
jgi:hypothetical protein